MTAGSLEDCCHDGQLTITTMEDSHYLAHELAQGQIRVIWILPDGEHKPIRCRMATVPLDGNHIALSYVWGTDEATHRIEVNGKPFYVRENLRDFLNHARTIHSGEFLWIDAICINQQDVEERNHQVRQMDSIYRSAQVVVSWLGCGSTDLEEWLPQGSNVSMTRVSDEALQQYITDTPTEVVLQNLKGISELEYWQRLWIVPEVLSAKNLQILYGYQSLSWLDLAVILNYINAKEDSMNKLQVQQLKELRCSRMATFVGERLADSQGVRRYGFQTLMSSYGMNDCSDKRDRVFALITLAKDIEASQIDYNEDAEALCVRILRLQKMSISVMCPFALYLLSVLGLDSHPIWPLQSTDLATSLHLPLPVEALSGPLRKKDVRWREIFLSVSLSESQPLKFHPAQFSTWLGQNGIELFESVNLDARFTIVTRRTATVDAREIICIIRQMIWSTSPELTTSSRNSVYRVPDFGILRGSSSGASLELSKWASLQICLNAFNITPLKSRTPASKSAINRGFKRRPLDFQTQPSGSYLGLTPDGNEFRWSSNWGFTRNV